MLKKGRIKISLGKPKEGKRRNEQKKKKNEKKHIITTKSESESERWGTRTRKQMRRKERTRKGQEKGKKSRDEQLTIDTNRNQSPLYLLSISTSEGRAFLPEKKQEKTHYYDPRHSAHNQLQSTPVRSTII